MCLKSGRDAAIYFLDTLAIPIHSLHPSLTECFVCFMSSGNDCRKERERHGGKRQKGRRKGEEEGWKGGEKEGRKRGGGKKGREGGRLDMGPDMSESALANDVLTFYKVSEHPSIRDIYYQSGMCFYIFKCF